MKRLQGGRSDRLFGVFRNRALLDCGSQVFGKQLPAEEGDRTRVLRKQDVMQSKSNANSGLNSGLILKRTMWRIMGKTSVHSLVRRAAALIISDNAAKYNRESSFMRRWSLCSRF